MPDFSKRSTALLAATTAGAIAFCAATFKSGQSLDRMIMLSEANLPTAELTESAEKYRNCCAITFGVLCLSLSLGVATGVSMFTDRRKS